jgi:hypothetical protein
MPSRRGNPSRLPALPALAEATEGPKRGLVMLVRTLADRKWKRKPPQVHQTAHEPYVTVYTRKLHRGHRANSTEEIPTP